jgi:hypothetical protein
MILCAIVWQVRLSNLPGHADIPICCSHLVQSGSTTGLRHCTETQHNDLAWQLIKHVEGARKYSQGREDTWRE